MNPLSRNLNYGMSYNYLLFGDFLNDSSRYQIIFLAVP